MKSKSHTKTLLAMAPAALAAFAVSGAETTEEIIRDLKQQNLELERRIEQLERLMGGQPAAQDSDAIAAEKAKNRFSLHGFLKADGFYTGGSVNSTDAPRWATPANDAGGVADSFTGTIQHSRLIAGFDGFELANGDASGLLEMDLFNLGDVPAGLKYNNNELRVRQLFVALKYDNWSVLAGQAWDLFAPLNPTSLNSNGNYWFGGNSGFRRPQLQFNKDFATGENSKLTLSGSVNANLGMSTFSVDTDSNGSLESFSQNTGQDSGIPLFEGALKYVFPGIDSAPTTVNMSGLYGLEEVDAVGTFGPFDNVPQWGVAIDVSIPIVHWLTVKAEAARGANLDAFLAGAGIDNNGDPIDSTSGWVQLQFTINPKLKANLSYGREEIDDNQLANGPRYRNQLFAGNALYSLSKNVVVGVEYDHFKTDYLNASSADADLIWGSLILNF